jgi:hypothetical protein
MGGTRMQIYLPLAHPICYDLLPDPDDDTESDFYHLTRLDNRISVIEQQDEDQR